MSSNNCVTVKRKVVVDLGDPEYFCNKSWTLSYNMNTMSWISFHTYTPNWYVGENNFFYSGLNGGCDITALAISEIPYTTTSTTTIPIPITTTTTTKGPFACNLVAAGTSILDCTLIASSATKTTTTTSTSSTTTTTTTICVGCSTYQVVSTTDTNKSIPWTFCNGVSAVIEFEPYQSLQLCTCSEPEISGFTISFTAEDCKTCFCYTFTNNTGAPQNIYWADCEGNAVFESLANGRSRCVCAIQTSAFSTGAVTITGGTTPCAVNTECGTPATPGLITATEDSACPYVYTFSVPALPAGATGLIWTLAPGMTILSQTSTSITASCISSGTVGTIFVYAVSDCGNSEMSTLAFTLPPCPTTTTTTSSTTTTTTTIPPIVPTWRCTAYKTSGGFDGKYSMEYNWSESPYAYQLDSMLLDGVEYASGEIININAPGDLVVAPGVFGGTYVQNISDWLNTIPGVNDAGFVFYDGMCTVDLPNPSSTYAIKITRIAGGGSIFTSSPPPWSYWYIKSAGFTGINVSNSPTAPSVGYGNAYVCSTI